MGHSHHHDHSLNTTRAFATVTLVNLAYTMLEAGYGFATNSLALLSDALHNLGDVLGLGLAWGAAVLAKRTPTARHTYGWRRATLLSPLANALLLVAFSGALAWEAVRRFSAPPEIPALPVMLVAAVGIAVNLGAAWLVRHGHDHDLNRRGAFLHLVADAAVSAGVVVAGVVVWRTDWAWVDPATGIVVSAVILYSTWKLVREAFDLLLDAVPAHIDPDAVAKYLAGLSEVREVHDLHVWSMSTTEVALTAHLVLPWPSSVPGFLSSLQHDLEHRFGIHHITIQLEDCTGAECAQAAAAAL